MAKSAPSLSRISLLLHHHKLTTTVMTSSPFSLFLLSKPKPSLSLFSTTATPYPLQYDLIVSRPANSSLSSCRPRPPLSNPNPNPNDDSELGFGDWVDKRLAVTDKSKRKYYNKRRKRMYGSDTEDEKERARNGNMKGVGKSGGDDGKGLVFLDEEKEAGSDLKAGVTEKKVEEFFKCLKKVPNKNAAEVGDAEPYIVTRNRELPPTWDGPNGTTVLVNKPKGWTSFTVCGKLRRVVNVKKVGHAGTLDPMATGLLIVCVGKATKLVDRYQGMIKGYSGVFRLGEATSTWDADSPVIQREPWEHIKDDDIKKAAASFCGEIWQVPPMFSAIKVGGERMYDKARKGESVELSPRSISIFQFDIERSLDDRQNLIFRVTCSKGTYIRSLCADLGKALGSCAHLTALRRDSIGKYSADNAWEYKELEEAITKGYL